MTERKSPLEAKANGKRKLARKGPLGSGSEQSLTFRKEAGWLNPSIKPETTSRSFASTSQSGLNWSSAFWIWVGLCGGAFVEPNRRKSKRKGEATRPRIGGWIPPACRNEWAGFYFRAGREVKARRRGEVRLPERRKRCCHLSRPVSRRKKDRESLACFLLPPILSPTKKSSLTWRLTIPSPPSRLSSPPFFIRNSILFQIFRPEFTRPILQSPALLKCATPYEDLLPFCSAHSPFTRN